MMKIPYPRKEINLYRLSIQVKQGGYKLQSLVLMEEKSKEKFLIQVRHFFKPFPFYHVFTLSLGLQLQ